MYCPSCVTENAATRRFWIGDRLPFVSGWPREEIERLFAAHQLVNIACDPCLDLVAAEEQRMQEEGLERRIRRRYAIWGDVPR
jgi:hypothetical protein